MSGPQRAQEGSGRQQPVQPADEAQLEGARRLEPRSGVGREALPHEPRGGRNHHRDDGRQRRDREETGADPSNEPGYGGPSGEA